MWTSIEASLYISRDFKYALIKYRKKRGGVYVVKGVWIMRKSQERRDVENMKCE